MPLTARAAPAVRPQRAAAAGDQRSSTVVLVRRCFCHLSRSAA